MHTVRWLASPRQGELTHTRSVCVGVAGTGGKKAKAKRKSKKKKKKQKQKQKAKATDFFMMPEGKALSFAAKS